MHQHEQYRLAPPEATSLDRHMLCLRSSNSFDYHVYDSSHGESICAYFHGQEWYKHVQQFVQAVTDSAQLANFSSACAGSTQAMKHSQ